MFQNDVLDKRSLPYRLVLEHAEKARMTNQLLPAEDRESSAGNDQESKSTREISGFDTNCASGTTSDFHQQSCYSQDSTWTLNTEFGRVSSSLASWDDDEFEKETSHRVEALLQELDAALYEGAPLFNKQLQEECTEWAAKFPYLRVIGKQIVPPRCEKGYSYHASMSQATRKQRISAASASAGSAVPKQLSLVGQRLKPISIRRSAKNDKAKDVIIEEVVIQDGVYEEYLAIDRFAEEADEYQLSHRSSSISALETARTDERLKGEIADALFETVWPEVEKTLIDRRSSSLGRGLKPLAEKGHVAAMNSELPPSSRNRLCSHISPATKKRVSSTALPIHGGKIGADRSKAASSVSRTAPAFVRGRPPFANMRETGLGSIWRNSRVNKLPPVETTGPHLPNVPVLKSQFRRAIDQVSKVGEDPLDGDEHEIFESAFATEPPMASTVMNMQDLTISNCSSIDTRSRNRLTKNDSTGDYKRRDQTVGLSAQHMSLVIQGYQRRGLSK